MKVLKSLIIYPLIVLFFWGVWNTSTEKASVKPFWLDELNELRITCRWNYWDTFIRGAYTQCSPQPLYYIISKAFFNIRKVHRDEPMREILIKSRTPSKISVVLLILVLIVVFRRYLGMSWKYLPVVIFVFLNYLGTEDGHIFWASTETRPYGFWCFVTGLNLLFLHATMDKWTKDATIDGRLFITYGSVSLLLMLTASPGIIQVFIPLIFAFSLWRFDRMRIFIRYPYIIGTLLLLAGVLMFLYYEMIGECGIRPFYGNTWGTIFQFFTGYRTPLMFMLMVLGWMHVMGDSNSMLSRMIFSQLIILTLMVIIVHIRDYYFVPRVFIMGHFLSFYLAIAGCKSLDDYVRLHLGKLAPILMPAFGVFIVLVALYHSPNLKEIINHGILRKPVLASEAVIDQKEKMVFPLCAPKQRRMSVVDR